MLVNTLYGFLIIDKRVAEDDDAVDASHMSTENRN